MSRKETISNLFLQKREAPAPSAATKPDTDRVRSGAIGAMGASLKEMAESAKHASDLQKQLEEANSILEIEPSHVEPSKIADRITIDIDPAFDELVESIRESGQQVPVLLRQSPDQDGRYQIAYGRRRLRAAQKLGIKVRAIVKKLSDDELIVAQGRENLDRQDLSFIEKAFFAKNMEDSGIERSVVISALGMDKSDVSRLISVAKNVPDDFIKIIGSAPKAGRKRWLELLEQLEKPEMRTAAEDFLLGDELTKLDSDQRFSKLMTRLRALGKEGCHGSEDTAAKAWISQDNLFSITMNRKPKQLDVSFKSDKSNEFGDWLSNNLDRLLSEFKQSKTKSGE